MARVYDSLSWFCSCTATSLLVFSLLIVPSNLAMGRADDDNGDTNPPVGTCVTSTNHCNDTNTCKIDIGVTCTSGSDVCKKMSSPAFCDGCSCRYNVASMTCECKQ